MTTFEERIRARMMGEAINEVPVQDNTEVVQQIEPVATAEAEVRQIKFWFLDGILPELRKNNQGQIQLNAGASLMGAEEWIERFGTSGRVWELGQYNGNFYLEFTVTDDDLKTSPYFITVQPNQSSYKFVFTYEIRDEARIESRALTAMLNFSEMTPIDVAADEV